MSYHDVCLCCGRKYSCDCAKADTCPVAGYCIGHCPCEKCEALRAQFAAMRRAVKP